MHDNKEHISINLNNNLGNSILIDLYEEMDSSFTFQWQVNSPYHEYQ